MYFKPCRLVSLRKLSSSDDDESSLLFSFLSPPEREYFLANILGENNLDNSPLFLMLSVGPATQDWYLAKYCAFASEFVESPMEEDGLTMFALIPSLKLDAQKSASFLLLRFLDIYVSSHSPFQDANGERPAGQTNILYSRPPDLHFWEMPRVYVCCAIYNIQ